MKSRLLRKKTTLQILSALLVCIGLSLGLGIASASESTGDELVEQSQIKHCIGVVYKVARELAEAHPAYAFNSPFNNPLTKEALKIFRRSGQVFYFNGNETGEDRIDNSLRHRFLGREKRKNRDEWPVKNYPYLPEELWKIRCLIELRLSHNEIQVIPPEIGLLVNLTVVDFSANNLRIIPEELAEGCPLLEKFICRWGQLRQLPTNFHELRNLRELDLRRNKFGQVAREDPNDKKVESLIQLAGMPKQARLFLHHNHFVRYEPRKEDKDLGKEDKHSENLEGFRVRFFQTLAVRVPTALPSITLTMSDVEYCSDGELNFEVRDDPQYPGVRIAIPKRES